MSAPFTMAKQTKMVFYVQDPCDERWSMVLHEKTIGLNLKMMIQPLILVSLLSPHKYLTSMEKKKLTTSMQIIMIMMKEN